jgi:four helix bundle protein
MGPGTIRSYRDLRVWQGAMKLAELTYSLAATLPRDELFGANTQMKRAAASIAANIAEGHSRRTRNEYLQFIAIAHGSLSELETHLELAVRVHLLTRESVRPALTQCIALGRQLHALRESLRAAPAHDNA